MNPQDMNLTEIYDWLQGDGRAAQNPKPELTAEAIQSHPVNAVMLPLPADASPALLQQAYDAALLVNSAADNATRRISGGEDFGYWQDGGPDAHEYFEPIHEAALDRIGVLAELSGEEKDPLEQLQARIDTWDGKAVETLPQDIDYLEYGGLANTVPEEYRGKIAGGTFGYDAHNSLANNHHSMKILAVDEEGNALVHTKIWDEYTDGVSESFRVMPKEAAFSLAGQYRADAQEADTFEAFATTPEPREPLPYQPTRFDSQHPGEDVPMPDRADIEDAAAVAISLVSEDLAATIRTDIVDYGHRNSQRASVIEARRHGWGIAEWHQNAETHATYASLMAAIQIYDPVAVFGGEAVKDLAARHIAAANYYAEHIDVYEHKNGKDAGARSFAFKEAETYPAFRLQHPLPVSREDYRVYFGREGREATAEREKPRPFDAIPAEARPERVTMPYGGLSADYVTAEARFASIIPTTSRDLTGREP